MSDFPESDERHFSGREVGADGRTHNISRTACNKCGKVLREMHMYCCGYSSSGFGQHEPHECKTAVSLREKLAKRLALKGYPGEDMYQRDTRHFLIMADECIRQMEWARTPKHRNQDPQPPSDLLERLRQAAKGDHSIPGRPGVAEQPDRCPKCLMDFAADLLAADLTLAPKDWKP